MGNSNTGAFNLLEHFAPLTEAMTGGFAFLADGLSDAEKVILATSMLDKALQLALTITFYKGAVSNTLMDRVFKGTGPLSTFSSKIDLAHIQGLTDENQNNDLKILRKVRNDFAHSLGPRRISEFASCDNLRLRSELVITSPTVRETNFLHSCAALVAQIMVCIVAVLAKHQIVSENRERFMAITHEIMATIFGAPDFPASDAPPPSDPPSE